MDGQVLVVAGHGCDCPHYCRVLSVPFPATVLALGGSARGRDCGWNGVLYPDTLEVLVAELDSTIHQPVRLQILSSLIALNAGEKVDFTYLRKVLNVTDGNLGAHLTKLENLGYIEVDKTFVARKPRTFINATDKGRDAFDKYITVLKQIIEGENR